MTLLDAVASVLEADGFPVRSEGELLHSAYQGPAGPFGLVALTVEAQGQVILYAVRGAKVAPERRAAVALLVAHESSRLAMASAEMDREHGQVRIRSSLDLATVRLADDDLGVLLGTLLRNTIVAANHVFALVDSAPGGQGDVLP